MGINVTISAGSLGSFELFKDSASAVAETIAENSAAFADAQGRTITLTFTQAESGTSDRIPAAFGRGESEFDVVVKSAGGAELAREAGLSLRALTSLVRAELDYALAVYGTVVAEVTVKSAGAVESDFEDYSDDEYDENEYEYPFDEGDESPAPAEDYSFKAAPGNVRDAIVAADAALSGVTVGDLLDSGVSPETYIGGVLLMRSAL